MKLLVNFVALVGTFFFVTDRCDAQVPTNIQSKLRELGTLIDPITLSAIYRPLHPRLPYAGVTVTRNVAYGPDARNILDIFTPATGAKHRPVLIFLPGGLGDKIETYPNGDAFYDNVVLWAARNGMIGINVERRGAFRGDVNGEDVGIAVRWVHAHARQYGGDPRRIYIWGHSSGAMSLADYLSRPQFQQRQGVLVRGAILMAGPYNLAPIQVPDGGGLRVRLGPDEAIHGVPPQPPISAEELLRTSVLPGLRALNLPLFITASERDPPLLFNSTVLLNDELRKAGRFPAFRIFKVHDHVSEIFSVGTSDVSVSGPILEWIRSLR